MLINDTRIRRLCLPDASREGWPHGPMLHPFSEGVQGGGVISFGLSHAGYDLRLDDNLLIFKGSYGLVINPKKFKDKDYQAKMFDQVGPSNGQVDGEYWQNYFILPPHSYALGSSLEYIRMPSFLKGSCVGKSSLARCGILINTTPLEPGWHGHLTLEISNIAPCPAMIFAREGIAQLEFELLEDVPETDYEQKGGKYQAQGNVPVPARVKE